MSAFIPDQLHHMSKSELLEFAQTAHEENVKLSKRVKELEQEKHKNSLETISDYILEFMQAHNIENFSTNRLSTSEGRQIELTIRYVDGETPAEQLAKANERVEFLRGKLTLLDNAVYNPVFPDDMAQRECRKIFDCELKDSIKKFTLGKKIDALDDLLEEIKCSVVVPKRYEQFQDPYLEGIKHCIHFIECQSEQLRKEQGGE
ncbi:hypothetical protein vBAmePPT11V19_00066 [Alteromonas phage vB_AmeP_PT11-V19]|nr:hypothetical protein vBAmePPT11V19_00066 [Alteromonas phage vB_AmeP_PT11-V19]